MFKSFDFEILQMRYIKAAMDEIPSFQPDGKAAAQAQAMIDAALAVRTTFQNADVTLGLARGELAETSDMLHTACVQVYAIMKNRFRADPGSLQAINRLPVDDRTTRDTVRRAEAISALWAQLPNPPGSATPFAAWATMDLMAFDALLTATRTQFQGFPAVDQDYQVAQGNLHQETEKLEDFTTAALITGRAQFEQGTAEREVIDAIPTEPAQQLPAQAVIGVASSPGPGQTHIEFSAEHATSYDVFERLAGEPQFQLVAADVIATSYDGSGLADGSYEYQVVGRNSRGEGPASDVASVEVAPSLPAARYNKAQVGPDTEVWVEVPLGLVDVQTLYLREGATEFFTAFSPPPGTVSKTSWPGMVISGAIDEVKIRNGQNEDIAVGVFDSMLPDPGP